MSESLELIGRSIALAADPVALFFTIMGTAIGIVFGGIPGLTAVTAMAVLLPMTFGMSPENAIFFFISIYVGSQFGNALPSILMRTPGTPASVMTAIEGHAFQQKGEGARALGISLVTSLWGQLFSFLLVAFLLFPIAEVAVRFLAPEVFALAFFGLMAASGLVGRDPTKGLIATVFGLALSTVGTDPVGGRSRFDFGVLELQAGLPAIPVIIGLLVVAELIGQARGMGRLSMRSDVVQQGQILPTWKELRYISRSTWVGSVVGFVAGVIPGLGASAGAFIAYQQARFFARDPSSFGGEEGSIEAVAAADAANNSSTGAEFIPTLALGIPGGPAMVLVLAALLLHGVTPGPGLFRSAPGALQATIGGLFMAPIAMALLGYAVIRPSVYIVSLSREVVTVLALVASLVGIFSLRQNVFDVYVALGIGLIGYGLQRFGYPMAPAALGYILGGIIEASLRRGLVMTFNDPLQFLLRPFVISILAVSIVLFVYMAFSKRGKDEEEEEGDEDEEVSPASREHRQEDESAAGEGQCDAQQRVREP